MKCNLCGSKDMKLLYKKSTFNIMKCDKCDFVVNDKWNILCDEIRKDIDNSLSIDSVKETFEREKDVYFDRFRKELIEISKFKKVGRMLDIGCGYGYFLELMRKEGWEAHGIDIDKNAVEFCKQYLSLNVKYGCLDEKQYPKKYFDVITLFHVLEHITNFQKTISIIEKILKPDGIIVIDVPNVNDLRRILFRENWAQFREHHLWYFSKSTIEFLLKKYGFKTVMTRYHGGSEILFTIERIFKVNTKRIINRYFKYLKPIKNIFTSLLNSLGFSEDIIIYAKNIDN